MVVPPVGPTEDVRIQCGECLCWFEPAMFEGHRTHCRYCNDIADREQQLRELVPVLDSIREQYDAKLAGYEQRYAAHAAAQPRIMAAAQRLAERRAAFDTQVSALNARYPTEVPPEEALAYGEAVKAIVAESTAIDAEHARIEAETERLDHELADLERIHAQLLADHARGAEHGAELDALDQEIADITSARAANCGST